MRKSDPPDDGRRSFNQPKKRFYHFKYHHLLTHKASGRRLLPLFSISRLGSSRPNHSSSNLQMLVFSSFIKRLRRITVWHPTRASQPAYSVSRYLRSRQTVNMSTRRSARLTAAAAAASDGNLSSVMPPAPQRPQPKKTARKRKAVSGEPPSGEASVDNSSDVAPPPVPTTPNKRRVRARAPATPTPSNARLIGEPATAAGAGAVTPKPKPATMSRLADPNRTNAPLLSPESSRLVTPAAKRRAASAASSASLSPSKASASAPATTTTTTTGILEEACAHLISVDPRMRPLIEAHPCRPFSPEGLAEEIDPFESLCSSIISQQVSGAAARSIKRRFAELFFPPAPPAPPPPPQLENEDEGEEAAEDGGKAKDEDRDGDDTGDRPRFPPPSQVAACSLERLRTAGLSQRKAEYVQGLAGRFVAGELSARLLADAPYEELLERLTAVRGLGLWSAEMFACFALKRTDVFSLGDLGVQRGMAAFVGRDVAKLKKNGGGGKAGGGKAGGGGGGKWKYMSEQEMRDLSAPFAPYRSLFMWYMWRVEQTDVSTLE